MNLEHDKTLSSILGTPTKMESLSEACQELHEMLVQHANWPENLGVEGYALKAMSHLYDAGERRGVAREKSAIAGLYPINDWWPERKPKPCSLTSSQL